MKRFSLSIARLCVLLILTLSFLSCKQDETPVLEETEDISSRYTGIWEGNLGFGAVPISMRVTRQVREFEGLFYVSSDFRACCGNGRDNGNITYRIEGDEVKDFKWVSIIPGCQAEFNGSGIINDKGQLVIDLRGENCDGHHVAKLTLNKLD